MRIIMKIKLILLIFVFMVHTIMVNLVSNNHQSARRIKVIKNSVSIKKITEISKIESNRDYKDLHGVNNVKQNKKVNKNKTNHKNTKHINKDLIRVVKEKRPTLSPEPANSIAHVSAEEHKTFPTDQDKQYPSTKDGTYGFVVQLTDGKNPRFLRTRGKETFYFSKKGQDFIFENIMIPIKNSDKRLPPDITSIFKGPDQLYYFIREDAYCRRPLNVSGIGLEPPDYCPEGNDVRELLACNIRQYKPEVEDLCNNPVLSHAFYEPDKKVAWLLRGKDAWLLHNLPNDPKASPSKCKLTKHGDITKIWRGVNPRADALFTIEEANNKPMLIQFYRHKYKIWNFKGGHPLHQGFIKEMPLNKDQYKNEMFTEKIPEVVKVEKKPKRKIVYKTKKIRELCIDPVIDSADANLDGSIVYLYKNDFYYQLKGLKEKGIGKLTRSGKSSTLHLGFLNSSSAVMTCKEGWNRGFVYEFITTYNSTSKGQPITQYSTWDIDGKTATIGQNWIDHNSGGLKAAFHNRNITNPVMIGLRDDDVFYFSTVAEEFVPIRRPLKHYKSPEGLPSGVTAAFSLSNSIIYLFKGKHYCVRGLYYKKQPPYCPQWRDSRELFGCFGHPPRPTPKPKKKFNYVNAMKYLCSDLNINDADRLWKWDDVIFVWRKDKFWRVADFPQNPRVVEYGLSAKKWVGFLNSPDAVTIIQESKVRRGWFYATYPGYWYSWYPDYKPWAGYKGRISKMFGAIMHNGDIKNPLLLGFEESDESVQYYSVNGSQLDRSGGSRLDTTKEHWPSQITAAFRMQDNSVYIFRKDKYCHRNWTCNDHGDNNCCKEWKDAKELFKCDSVINPSIHTRDGSDGSGDYVADHETDYGSGTVEGNGHSFEEGDGDSQNDIFDLAHRVVSP